MPRRLNFTGRRKILREHVHIAIRQQAGELHFDARLDLEAYQFPDDARVHVEAYRGLSALWQRFDYGRVSLSHIPEDRSLKLFERPEGILFRVKVTAEGEQAGRLLGEADGLRPLLPDQTELPPTPLIQVDRQPLRGQLWRVECPDDGKELPTLFLNDRIEDWTGRSRDPVFRALVSPEVMRQLLTEILVFQGDAGDEDDPEDWRQRWLRFAEELPNVGDSPDPLLSGFDPSMLAEVREWINRAVSAFGERAAFIDPILNQWNAG